MSSGRFVIPDRLPSPSDEFLDRLAEELVAAMSVPIDETPLSCLEC